MDETTTPTPIAAERVFAAWSGMRSVIALRTLSADSIQSYRSIWNSWCEFVAQRGCTWSGVDSADVRIFLETLPSSSATRSGASPVTQKRYFRVLKEIYGCAVASGWLPRNPVDHDALVSKSEAHDSLVFNRLDWAELYRHLPPAAEVVPHNTQWQAVRDHSLLLMMMQAGLTVAELRGLDLAHVHHPRLLWMDGAAVLRLPFLPWEPEAKTALTLQIAGVRAAQSRTLTLHGPCDIALLAWLSVRLDMRIERQASSALYISQKGGSRLSAKSIFMLANHHVLHSLRDRYAGEDLAHAGPMTLRNSCIVRWLDAGLEDAEVLARAGLKEAQALRRLRHHTHRHADLTPPSTPRSAS